MLPFVACDWRPRYNPSRSNWGMLSKIGKTRVECTLRQLFTDFECYREACKNFEMEFLQLDCGPLKAWHQLEMVRDVQVLQTTLNRRFHQSGRVPTLGPTFGLRRRVGGLIRWQNTDFDETSLAVFASDGSFEAVSNQNFDVYAITIARVFFRAAAEIQDVPDVVEALPPNGAVLTCEPFDLEQLRATVQTYLAVAQESKLRTVAMALEGKIARLVISLLSRHSQRRESRNDLRRDRALEAALALIQTANGDKINLHDLCCKTEVSERTLRYAFEERLGVSPKTYINAFRLNQVRYVLRDAAPGQVAIRDVAADQGFWHPGQFSTDYRRMFGESPRETLRRDSCAGCMAVGPARY